MMLTRAVIARIDNATSNEFVDIHLAVEWSNGDRASTVVRLVPDQPKPDLVMAARRILACAPRGRMLPTFEVPARLFNELETALKAHSGAEGTE